MLRLTALCSARMLLCSARMLACSILTQSPSDCRRGEGQREAGQRAEIGHRAQARPFFCGGVMRCERAEGMLWDICVIPQAMSGEGALPALAEARWASWQTALTSPERNQEGRAGGGRSNSALTRRHGNRQRGVEPSPAPGPSVVGSLEWQWRRRQLANWRHRVCIQ